MDTVQDTPSEEEDSAEDSVAKSQSEEDEDMCPLCKDIYGAESLKILGCQHCFHDACWDVCVQFHKSKQKELLCPMCRGVVTDAMKYKERMATSSPSSICPLFWYIRPMGSSTPAMNSFLISRPRGRTSSGPRFVPVDSYP